MQRLIEGYARFRSKDGEQTHVHLSGIGTHGQQIHIEMEKLHLRYRTRVSESVF